MSRWSKDLVPFADGHKAPMRGLADATLAERLVAYRRDVAKRYRVTDISLADRVFTDGPLYVSTKLDGELWFAVKRGDDVALCAYNGRVLVGLSIVEEVRARLAGAGDVIVAGELVAPPDDGRPRVGHVARSLSVPEEAGRLRWYAFDVVEADGVPAGALYADKLAWLRRTFGEASTGGERVATITTAEGEPSDVLSYWREWVATQRFEGLVVRTALGATHKVKPYFSIDAVVIAYGTRVTEGRTELRELSVALRRDDGTLQLFGTVGGGLSTEDRIAWLARLAPMEVPSKFRMANRDGGLSRFVRPEIVVEIQLSDLVDTDSDDRTVARMTLSYDAAAGYVPRGDAPVPYMLFPVLLRERSDKLPDVAGIGMQQITSRLQLADDASMVERRVVAPATLVRRVYRKGDAVRKVVVLDLHAASQEHPRFVVFSTDYSAGRAEPLKTSLKSCSTRDKADAVVERWLKDNVKKGWDEVVPA